MSKKILFKFTPEFVGAFNRLTPQEAIELLCRNEVNKSLTTLIAMTKNVIGMCVDEEPHDLIRAKLWEIVEMLYGLRSYGILKHDANRASGKPRWKRRTDEGSVRDDAPGLM